MRVVGNDGSNWVLDLDPQKKNMFWKFMDYGKKTNLYLHKEVRVVENDASNWVFDTDPQKVNMFGGFRLW